jgi:hypothetical protein
MTNEQQAIIDKQCQAMAEEQGKSLSFDELAIVMSLRNGDLMSTLRLVVDYYDNDTIELRGE